MNSLYMPIGGDDEQPTAARLAGAALDGKTTAPVLVVDDDAVVRRSLRQCLEREGLPVEEARDGMVALDLLAQRRFSLVLLDIIMPGPNGLEVLKEIRETHDPAALPVIMVTGLTLSDAIVDALNLGANDYVTKPVDYPVALARIRTHLALRRLVAELAEANQKLAELSHLDGLTGIANRRRLDEVLAREWARASRDGTPLAAIMADIDHFKAFNDTQGHEAGDEALKAVAHVLRSGAQRPTDLVARYGGDEFLLLLANTPVDHALAIAERLRGEVEGSRLNASRSSGDLRVTLSLGVACNTPQQNEPVDALVSAADAALYQAKQRRNCVRVAEAGSAR